MITNKKKYNVLFIPSWYPSRTDLMSGLFVFHHAKSINKHTDFNVSCLYVLAEFDKNSKPVSYQFSDDEGIKTLRIFIKKNESKIGKFSFWFLYIYHSIKGYYWLKNKIGKPDICHVNIMSRTGILALFLKYFYNIPYIITEHWSRYLPENDENYAGFIRKKITHLIVKKSNAVTTVSARLANAMMNLGLKNNYHIISNVVDMDLFKIKESKIKSEKTSFIHVSCFDEKAKNIKGILDVVKILKDKKYNFLLTIVGDGIDFDEVKKHAENIEIMDYVFFKGVLFKENLMNEMAHADCFILNSNYENQGVVLLESLCCGVPVIATNVGGVPEFINNNNGILIEPNSTLDLKNAMLKFINNEIKFDPNKLRNSVAEMASEKNVAQKFENIYLNILEK